MSSTTPNRTKYAIRLRASEDLPGCVLALRGVFEKDGYPLTWPADPERWLAPRRQRQAWVALSPDGTVIGHVALSHLDGHPMARPCISATGKPLEHLISVSRLIVSPPWRRQGIAASLMDVAVRYAHSDQRQPVLDVGRANLTAISLYTQLGWDQIAHITVGTVTKIPVAVFVGPPPVSRDEAAFR